MAYRQMDPVLCSAIIHNHHASWPEMVDYFAHSVLANLAVNASLCSKSQMEISLVSMGKAIMDKDGHLFIHLKELSLYSARVDQTWSETMFDHGSSGHRDHKVTQSSLRFYFNFLSVLSVKLSVLCVYFLCCIKVMFFLDQKIILHTYCLSNPRMFPQQPFA